MIFGSIGTVSSTWEPPIPMSGLLEWYEPGNTAGITIGNDDAPMDKMINLVNPEGSSYQQLGTSEFGSDSLGATTITSTASANNSWYNSTNWSALTAYTIIIISKYNSEEFDRKNTFIQSGSIDPAFKFGNAEGSENVCIVNGTTIYGPIVNADTNWAMYTLSGSVANNLHFYRNTFDLLGGGAANFQSLPSGTLIFTNSSPYTSSSVGAILLYSREITEKERNSVFQHYKKQFPLSDT